MQNVAVWTDIQSEGTKQFENNFLLAHSCKIKDIKSTIRRKLARMVDNYPQCKVSDHNVKAD
jgi:hypothetical protein